MHDMEQPLPSYPMPATNAGVLTPPPAPAGYDVLKRVLDVTIAICVLVVLSPLWLVIGCAIKARTPCPGPFACAVEGRGSMPPVCTEHRPAGRGILLMPSLAGD
jgi:lipopolysaccharide/colanic/teichoic acid biosynthesis glycosyltransferase